VSFLHITNGDHAKGVIAASGIPGTVSIWAEPLNEGPVPGDITDEQLRTIRARFIAGSGRGERFESVLAELERWTAALDRRSDHSEAILWFEHDLFDQLALVQVLDRIGSVPSATPVTLICIDRFPGHAQFKGLGELTPGELATLFETRQPVTAAHIELASRAWRAFRGVDPTGIEALLQSDMSVLPFLGPALVRHLEEFPWVDTGLSRSELRLLQLVADKPQGIRDVFPRMHDGESAFYITDSSLWDLVRRLSMLDPPLVVVDIQSEGDRALPRATVEATVRGRAIVAGHGRVDRSEIDRWHGGVHLDRRSPMWWWDPKRRRLVQHPTAG
jgi:hypothetical protein